MRRWIPSLCILIGVCLPYVRLGIVPPVPVFVGAALVIGVCMQFASPRNPAGHQPWRRPLLAVVFATAIAYNIASLPRQNAHAAGLQAQRAATFEQLASSLAVPFAQETLQLHLALREILEGRTLVAYGGAPISSVLLYHVSYVSNIRWEEYAHSLTPDQERTLRALPHRFATHNRQQPFLLVASPPDAPGTEEFILFTGAHAFYVVPESLAPNGY